MANYQDLLKTLALLVMLVDHAGVFLYPENPWFRACSGFVMPIFAFYSGYNFHDSVRHLLWMLGFVIMALMFIVFDKFSPNILISISLGQLYLSFAGAAILQYEGRFLKHFLVMLVLTPFTCGIIEFGTLVIAFMQIGYLHAHKKEDNGYLLLALLVLSIFYQYYSWVIKEYNLLGTVLALGSIFVAGFLLWRVDHKRPIPINLKPISRNMVYVYTISYITYIILAIAQYYLYI